MKLFEFFKLARKQPPSADTAKQRLQFLLAIDRQGGPDFLPLLQKELMDVIRKYVDVDEKRVIVDFQHGQGFSTLEVNVELPNAARAPAVA
ncbi:MAG: cell division topological specificity factor MinE [Geminicoccaceae bacterium]|nr:cell division topological specificity factor MinE [Geminicoccaceae bacterium]